MNYIKAKLLKGDKPSGRAYTYRTADDVKTGDLVTDGKGSKLIVVDEPVDAAWIMAYGADKVAVVKKYEEPVSDNIGWITTVPATDGNFISHLKGATEEEIRQAISIMENNESRGNKSRISACERELRKRGN